VQHHDLIHRIAAVVVMSQTAWRLQNPVGFSAVLVDQNVYRQMVALSSTLGVRVDGLPIQVSHNLMNGTK
jgi:hypothetical protein